MEFAYDRPGYFRNLPDRDLDNIIRDFRSALGLIHINRYTMLIQFFKLPQMLPRVRNWLRIALNEVERRDLEDIETNITRGAGFMGHGLKWYND